MLDAANIPGFGGLSILAFKPGTGAVPITPAPAPAPTSASDSADSGSGDGETGTAEDATSEDSGSSDSEPAAEPAATKRRKRSGSGGVDVDTQSDFTNGTDPSAVDDAVDGQGGGYGVGSNTPAVCELHMIYRRIL